MNPAFEELNAELALQRSAFQSNVKAREEAEGLFKELADLYDEHPRRFWETLRELVDSKIPTKTEYDPEAPMDELEAIRFEKHKIGYGQFYGQEVGMIPPSRIGWYVENEFAVKLRRYIKSERFQRRQREE